MTPAQAAEPAADIRTRILAAALSIVEEQGVTAMTQPRVARLAGVRQSHLTYYFPRKADLLLAVMQYSHERAARSRETQDFYEFIAALMFDRRRAQFFLDVVVEISATPDLRDVLAEHSRHFHLELARHFDRAADDPAIAAFVDRLRGMSVRSLMDGNPADASAVRELANKLRLEALPL